MTPHKSSIPCAPLNESSQLANGVDSPSKWKDFPNPMIHNISVIMIIWMHGLIHSTTQVINFNICGFPNSGLFWPNRRNFTKTFKSGLKKWRNSKTICPLSFILHVSFYRLSTNYHGSYIGFIWLLRNPHLKLLQES